jgi:hypothetical protein
VSGVGSVAEWARSTTNGGVLSAEFEVEIRELETHAQERLLRLLPEKLDRTSDPGIEHAWQKMGSHAIGSLLTATLEHWARLDGGNLPA